MFNPAGSAFRGAHANAAVQRMKSFLKRTLITGLAVLIAAKIVGINCTGQGVILAAIMLVVLNEFVRPVMLLLSLPLLVFTLGLFVLVINACLLWLVGRLLKGDFEVDNFRTAFWGALVISIVSLVLNALTKTGNSTIRFYRGKPPPRPPKDGGGPVIDV
jgi:putative membrane protein